MLEMTKFSVDLNGTIGTTECLWCVGTLSLEEQKNCA